MPLTKHHRNSKIYPFIKKNCWEKKKQKIYKECKTDNKKYLKNSNKHQKAVKMFNMECEKTLSIT